MNPTHHRLKAAALVVISLNIMLAVVCFLVIGTVYAQGEDKGETTLDSGVRFDGYPHPLSTGALAYSIADRWDYTDLTYYFWNCPSAVNCDDGQDAVRTA